MAEVTKAQSDMIVDIMGYTSHVHIENWMANIRGNMPELLKVDENDISKMPKPKGSGSCIIISGGPSIGLDDVLPRLASSDYKGTVICIDKMLRPCLEHGIIPDYVCSFDTHVDREGYEFPTFFDYDIVRNYSKKIMAVFGTISPPEVINKWDGPKYLFHPYIDLPQVAIHDESFTWKLQCPKCNHVFFDNHPINSITKLLQRLTKHTIIDTLGNVGGLALWISRYLECEPVCLVGYDYCYKEERPEDTSDYDVFRSRGLTKEKAKSKFKWKLNDDKTERYLTEDLMESYAILLKNVFSRVLPKVRTINCSEFSALSGEGIEHMKFEVFLEEFKR